MPTLSSTWVAACRVSGRFDPWPVLEALGGPEAFETSPGRVLASAGFPLDAASRVAGTPALDTVHPFVIAGTLGYPPALRGLPHAPPVLFLAGEPACFERPAVAIVGSRNCTGWGLRTARTLAHAVALAGGVVVSGLARGIDTAAHEGALEGGFTIGVPGHGLDATDRPAAARLIARILEAKGLVASEFLPDEPAQRWTFLQRNRVIAGLARVVVVVEADHRSGALSTARHGLALGREVLAVPGPWDARTSQGCLDLLEDGATLVRGPRTVLAAAGLDGAAQPATGTPPAARILEEALGLGGTVDQVAARAGLGLVETLRLLADLEVAGLVRRQPGQRYERA
ncbi:MAG: DNA-processing protein DprA [Deltaproteobacteria bacterium]|nr:DNA-processing protein DprA [Deltaproteobacteria bacterium]